MIIHNNFSDTHLLFSEPVSFTIYNDESSIILAKFKIILPTIRDLYFNEDVASLLHLLGKSISELKEELKVQVDFSSHLELLQHMIMFSSASSGIALLLTKIIQGLQYLCPGVILKDGVLKIYSIEFTDELLESFRHIWLIAIGNKIYNTAYNYMSPEQRLLEEKIQAIKNKGKNNQKSASFEKMYMILTYEFGYKREEILSMTMHTARMIMKYTSKSINYKLTLAAKAYGNTKKVKFITEQGE